MKKHGKKFKAAKKLEIIEHWKAEGCGRYNANHVARVHSCSAQSIYLWHKKYDGSVGSLENGNQTPHRLWNKYSDEDLSDVKNMINDYGNIGRLEMFGRLQVERGFSKSIRTLYRMLNALHVAPLQDIVKYIPEPYETPQMPGIKWQMDVKWVPSVCLRNIPNSTYYYRDGSRFYQYTCIDECTRKRFVYAYDSFGKKETIDFLKRCIVFFGYKPLMVQTDNGPEFTNNNLNTKAEHVVTKWLTKQKIMHKLIRPATPRHNGKVERSHRTDNQEFYFHYQDEKGFISLAHIRAAMKDWCYRYNDVRPMTIHNYKTPSSVEQKLLEQLRRSNGQTVYLDVAPKNSNNERPKLIEKQGTVTFIQQNLNWAFASRPLSDLPDWAT